MPFWVFAVNSKKQSNSRMANKTPTAISSSNSTPFKSLRLNSSLRFLPEPPPASIRQERMDAQGFSHDAQEEFQRQLVSFTGQLAFSKDGPGLPGTPILIRVAGSRSFNCHGPQSDWDWNGIYVTPLEELLSLDPPKGSVKGDVPNFQFWELRRFAELLAKGDPHAIECLYAEHLQQTSNAWEKLRLIRHRFITQQVVIRYVRYVESQIRRYADGQSVAAGSKPGEKWLYHIVRLAKDAMTMAGGKQPVIWKDGSDREFILRIRTGQIPRKDVVNIASGIINTVKGMEPFPLPAEPDIPALERWMMDVRGIK